MEIELATAAFEYLGLLGAAGIFGSKSKKRTTVNTTTSTEIRDIGFTGQQGVDLATNLAVIGAATSSDLADAGVSVGESAIEQGGDTGRTLAVVGGAAGIEFAGAGRDVSIANLEASRRTGSEILEASGKGFDTAKDLSLISSQNLKTVTQQQGDSFNRLVGGAGELVKSSGEQAAELLGITADVSRSQTAAGRDALAQGIEAGERTFDRIVTAARGLAQDLTQGSTAFVEGATATVERLGPQTRQNQQIAIAGLGVAAVTVAIFLFANRRR